MGVITSVKKATHICDANGNLWRDILRKEREQFFRRERMLKAVIQCWLDLNAKLPNSLSDVPARLRAEALEETYLEVPDLIDKK